MNLEVTFEPDARLELGNLSTPLLREAFELIVKLKTKPYLGQKLGEHPETGDLSDCRKLYFNQAKHRVLYQLQPDEAKPKQVRILAVGKRADLAVYHKAAEALGRTPGEDAPPN